MTDTGVAPGQASGRGPAADGTAAPAVRGKARPRLLFVQYGAFAGDYARLMAGGDETYGYQRHSVGFVDGLRADHAVTVLTLGERAEEIALAPGLSALTMTPAAFHDLRALRRVLRDLAPDRMVVRAPHRQMLACGALARVPMLPLLADIVMPAAGLKDRLRQRALAILLRAPGVPCAANHGLNAARSLVEVLGLPPGRVVPWDWPSLEPEPTPKAAPADPSQLSAFFAGAVIEGKGVGDCIGAAAALAARGTRLALSIAGDGELEFFRAMAERLGVADRVRFLGRLPAAEVRSRMRMADLVMVPTRRSYAEGMPKVVNEGLASRTPLVVSDHPAFAGRLADGRDALVFPAGDAKGLADAILRLAGDPALYARLSENAAAALAGLRVGVEWTEAVRLFLDDPRDRTGWVARHALDRVAC